MYSHAEWITLIGRLLLESLLAVGAAIILAKLTRKPEFHRAIWQSAMVALLLITLVELSGLANVIRVLRAKTTLVDTLPEDVVHHPERHETKVIAEKTISYTVHGPEFIPQAPEVSWPAWVWFPGTALLIARLTLSLIITSLVKRSATLNTNPVLLAEIRKHCGKLGLAGAIPLYVSDRFKTPAAFGFFQKAIGVPGDFEKNLPLCEQHAVLAHELIHLKNGDFGWRCVIDFIVALVWWNPLLWFIRNRFLESSEQVADAGSVTLTGDGVALADCLVRYARTFGKQCSGVWSRISGGQKSSHLKKRVEALLQPAGWAPGIHKVRGWQMILWSFLGCCLILGLVAGILLPHPQMRNTRESIRRSPLFLIAALAINPVRDNSSIATPPAPLLEQNDLPDIRKPAAKLPGATIQIKARWIEITTHQAEELGLEGLLPADNQNHETFQPTWRAQRLDTPSQGKWKTNQLLGAQIQAFGEKLSAENATVFLKTIEQHPGAEVVTSPTLITANGQEGEIRVNDILTIVTGFSTNASKAGQNQELIYATEKIAVGPSLRVTPEVTGNNQIRLMVKGLINEFNGYEKPGNRDTIKVRTDAGMEEAVRPLPSIRQREFDADAVIANGGALLLGGITIPDQLTMVDKIPVLGDVPLLGRLFRTEHHSTVRKHMLILIEATIAP